jgi:nitroimidazol reductase NimA-like FMN-containing flavoprotein (pyridoxamine 5'-phosphate oxidase superfamily)
LYLRIDNFVRGCMERGLRVRKKEKEITEPGMIEEIINSAEVCRIAVCDNDMPYIIPMNFGYRNGSVYLHSAREGRKVEALKKSNRVCFEVDVDHELVRAEHSCGFDMRYRSVIGFGRAYIVEDDEVKRCGLDIIMEHYGEKGPHIYNEKNLSLTLVIRIDIEEITCKANGY